MTDQNDIQIRKSRCLYALINDFKAIWNTKMSLLWLIFVWILIWWLKVRENQEKGGKEERDVDLLDRKVNLTTQTQLRSKTLGLWIFFGTKICNKLHNKSTKARKIIYVTWLFNYQLLNYFSLFIECRIFVVYITKYERTFSIIVPAN